MDVPEERLELSRDNSQRLLRPQRLPISPSGPFDVLQANSLEINSLLCYTKHNKAANINLSAILVKIKIKICASLFRYQAAALYS